MELITAHPNYTDPISAFRAALIDAGLRPDEIVADGNIQRCPTNDHPKSKNGWYVLYSNPPAGGFGNWATGLSESWSLNGESLSAEELARIRNEIERQRAEREKERTEKHRSKANEAQRYLTRLSYADESNPYLSAKGVRPCLGLVMDGDALIVPVHSPEDYHPMGYQRINAEGGKKFMPGARVAGGYFAIKGSDKATLIAEGIATALSLNEATELTVLVAFSAGNLKAVARMVRTRYPDRQIIICADNDAKTAQKTGTNPGVDAAQKTALAVNGLVAVPDRPGDFNDLHVSEGLATVVAAIEAVFPPKAEDSRIDGIGNWPDPIPLIADEKPMPYPVDALPGVIGEAVAEVTEFVQCPAALTACSALSAISTVGAGLVDVQRANQLVGPTSLFLMAIADSGERKSTVDGYFTKAIREYEAVQEELAQQALRDYRSALGAWEAKKAGTVNAIRDASKKGKETAQLERQLARIEANRPEKPKIPKLLIGDATCEALTYRLSQNWPVGGVLSSEAGIVLGGHAMGKDSVMRNLATLNTLWDGQALSVERRTSESYAIRSARLSLGLAVQPETVRQFIDGTGGLARGSGFLARFLVTWPESTQGKRKFREPPEHWPALSKFQQQLSNLLNLATPFDDSQQLIPTVLMLSPEASKIWIAFHDEIEAELSPIGEMADARDVASKAADNAARVAALFHMFEQGPIGEIAPHHMEAAARIIKWHLYEARRFLIQIAIPPEVGNAMLLESWLLDRCRRMGIAEVPVNHIQKYGPNRVRRKECLSAALVVLENAARIRCATAGRKKSVKVNPALLPG